MPQIQNVSEVSRLTPESRHKPSGLNSRFNGSQSSFEEYITISREMLFKAHSGKLSSDLEKIVSGNAPFELRPADNSPSGKVKPYRRGILLIHGLTDSPYFMRHLAAFFQKCGFRVMAILLPGHGTQPGDLLDVRWQEWARAVTYGVEQLAGEADEIYLAGYSAGATLAIRHSLLDDRVRGLLLFSPALRIAPRAARASLHKLYSWLRPSAKWVGIKPDKDIFKYESFPKNAAFQIHALSHNLQKLLLGRELKIPVFTAASENDATVDSSAMLEFMARSHHPGNRLVYYTTDTAKYPPGLPEKQVELIFSVVPDQNITCFAHTSILLPPEDAHYGIAGEYSNCVHYYPDDMEKYAVCMANTPPVLQGEVTEKNLRTGIMRRLMYNPHFAELEISMQRFIGGLS